MKLFPKISFAFLLVFLEEEEALGKHLFVRVLVSFDKVYYSVKKKQKKGIRREKETAERG